MVALTNALSQTHVPNNVRQQRATPTMIKRMYHATKLENLLMSLLYIDA